MLSDDLKVISHYEFARLWMVIFTLHDTIFSMRFQFADTSSQLKKLLKNSSKQKFCNLNFTHMCLWLIDQKHFFLLRFLKLHQKSESFKYYPILTYKRLITRDPLTTVSPARNTLLLFSSTPEKLTPQSHIFGKIKKADSTLVHRSFICFP